MGEQVIFGGRARRSVRLWCAVVAALNVAGITRAESVDDQLIVRRSPYTGLASFVTALDGGPIFTGAGTARAGQPLADFWNRQGHLFGIANPTDELRVARTTIDDLGQTHTTYQQVYHGVPVFSGVLKIHQNARAAVVAANGDFYPLPAKLDPTPTVSSEEATAIASARIDADEPTVERVELVIVDPGWYGDPPAGPHLAYYVILRDPPLGLREAFFVDAHSGSVLDQWKLVHTARNRLIYDANFHPYLPGDDLVRWEGSPSVLSPREANLAYDYAGDLYDYFSRAFGRDSIDDAGMGLILTVQSTAPPCPNALWTGGQMVFCEGTVTDDVTAHEAGHGITDYTADLIYQNQPGQLNEAYSDIWGELVDLFNGDVAVPGPAGGTPWPRDQWYLHEGLDEPNNARSTCSHYYNDYADGVRWLIAEEASAFGGAIRDMWQPPCFGHPDRANSLLQTCNPFDNGGVHSGSGIPNHAFAIMTDGKTFNGQTVSAIGPIKAAAVWYRALTVYLTPGADFKDAYSALNQAAQDLIGTTPLDPRTGGPSDSEFTALDAEQVDKALLAVEMNTDGACGAIAPVLSSEPPAQCSPHQRIYFEDFENGAPGWTVWNTSPPTAYDWVLSDDLPFWRPGTAWYCADPDFGDCVSQDESAKHTLYSPEILIPAEVDQPMLMFTHYMASEPGWDGGLLKIIVHRDGVPEQWYLISRYDFVYNSYNSRLNSAAEGNTNPLNDTPAWTGVGGEWGTSLVDLSDYVIPLDRIQIVFDFGKDGCNGVDGWYVDDVGILDCAGVDIVGSVPASGALDARWPHPPDEPANLQGWDTIDIGLSDPAGILFDAFEITEVDGDGIAPRVTGITSDGSGTYRLTLSEPIEPGAWTKIEHPPANWSICLGFLPGDVNGNKRSSDVDVNMMISVVNALPGQTLPAHATDINRSGTVNARDILDLIDLLNGAGAHATWWGQTLSDNPCN